MTKSINKVQIDALVSLMQGQPDIARGFYKGSKEALNRFWANAEEELNSAGPPTKCIAEWKKVWADQKRYVRQKAASNMRHAKGTGGGPNRQYKLAATEVAIYELIGMKESVEGVARRFGLPQPAKSTNIGTSGTAEINSGDQLDISSSCEIIECDVVNEVEVVADFAIEDEPARAPVSVNANVDKSVNVGAPASVNANVNKSVNVEEERPTSSRRSKSRKAPSEVLEEELSIQREMCSLMKEQVLEAAKQTKILKKNYALKKKQSKIINKYKKEKLELLRKQTAIMEQTMLGQIPN